MQLRASTGDLHARLDEALALARDNITREKYIAFLRGSLTALDALEPQLASFSPLLFPLPHPSRCDLLREDLTSLAAAPATVSALPEVPAIDSASAAFGARYVIEGSSLGGAVLARSFDAALHLNGESLRYLTLHGPNLRDHWRAFCAELEQFDRTATPSMRAEACESARAVFNLYYAAFRTTGAIAVIP